MHPLFDLYLGTHGWYGKIGDNYGIKVVHSLTVSVLNSLVQRSRPSKRAVLLGLRDNNDIKIAHNLAVLAFT